MPVQQDLGGVMGVGGGHGQGHTMVGFVGACDTGRGYMMSDEYWLQSSGLQSIYNTFSESFSLFHPNTISVLEDTVSHINSFSCISDITST